MNRRLSSDLHYATTEVRSLSGRNAYYSKRVSALEGQLYRCCDDLTGSENELRMAKSDAERLVARLNRERFEQSVVRQESKTNMSGLFSGSRSHGRSPTPPARDRSRSRSPIRIKRRRLLSEADFDDGARRIFMPSASRHPCLPIR